MPDTADDEANPLEALELSQDAVHLKDCIAKLSETHRRMIHLAFYEDLSYREICEIEGCPVGTVKTRILHAKKLLMRDLALLSLRRFNYDTFRRQNFLDDTGLFAR